MSVPPKAQASAALARVFWMLLGPMALVLTAMAVLRAGRGWLTGADVAYLSFLAAVLLARWFEFRAGDPQTADGEPATAQDLRRYLVVTTTVGLVVWVALNLVANYWLAG